MRPRETLFHSRSYSYIADILGPRPVALCFSHPAFLARRASHPQARLRVVSSVCPGRPGRTCPLSLPAATLALRHLSVSSRACMTWGVRLQTPGRGVSCCPARPAPRRLYLDGYGQPGAPVLVHIHGLFPDPQVVRVQGRLRPEERALGHGASKGLEARTGAARGFSLVHGLQCLDAL